MHEKRIQIYLDDHLAMVIGEIELIERCHRSNEHSELGSFLERLNDDVRGQKGTIEEVLKQLGHESGIQSQLKQGAAWFAEKLGRFKLNDSFLEYSELSRVVELETLAAAAQERIALWDSLDNVTSAEPRCEGITFSMIREQSEKHLDDLKSYRRSASLQAFVDEQP
jgi:hypothetical protein